MYGHKREVRREQVQVRVKHEGTSHKAKMWALLSGAVGHLSYYEKVNDLLRPQGRNIYTRGANNYSIGDSFGLGVSGH